MFYNRTSIKKVYMGKFNKGDDIIGALEEFCRQKKIRKGFVQIIGAVENTTLGYYNLNDKKYSNRTFDEHAEILSMSGNISIMDGDVSIHLHGAFGKDDFQSIGGHLGSPCIIFAGEYVILELKGRDLVRQFDEPTGLHLWQ